MKQLLNKIKNLRKKDKYALLEAKIANLEAQISTLEQANLIILSKLLEISNSAKALNKIYDKTQILSATTKGLNAGKTPTVH